MLVLKMTCRKTCAAFVTTTIILLSVYSEINFALSRSERSCPAKRPCPVWQFQCGEGLCINMRKFCDNHVDCPDGKDERMVDVEGETNDIKCNNELNLVNKSCSLSGQYACDGVTHCRDKVDESQPICGEKNRYKKVCQYWEIFCINDKVLPCSECQGLTSDIPYDDGPYQRYTGSDSEHHCASTIFMCEDGSKCLRADQFCNGFRDCEDGSDEIRDKNASTKGIWCNNKWNYFEMECVLPWRYACDGIDHCEDLVDENNCNSTKEFICNNGRRLKIDGTMRHRLIGDGMDDCGDSSDEIRTGFRRQFIFNCLDSNKTEFAFEKFCDGVIDCPNGIDELNSTFSNITTTKIACINKLGVRNDLRCFLPDHLVCDGYINCKDHSDEWNCTTEHHFNCENKRVVSKHIISQQCNFRDECLDSSDECNISSCNKTFTCKQSGKCIAFERFCDGFEDCEDGSDEIGETLFIPGGEVVCNNFHNECNLSCLLPKKYTCDGMQHCSYREDECTIGCFESFTCDNGECIPMAQFCDGETNCEDMSDEKTNTTGFKCSTKSQALEVSSLKCVLPQTLIHHSDILCAEPAAGCHVYKDPKCFKCLTMSIYISPKQVGDGVIDCPDASDECLLEGESSANNSSSLCFNICLAPGDTCGHCRLGETWCGEKCVQLSKICDGTKDCRSGVDEKFCSASQQKNQNTKKGNFNCTNSPKQYAVECDGIPECWDFSDECTTLPTIKETDDNIFSSNGRFSKYKCTSNKMNMLSICQALFKSDINLHHCPDGKHPLRTQEICDGEEKCSLLNITKNEITQRSWKDFSADEKFCESRRFLCNESQPVDDRKVSISLYQVCDGKINCKMAEDETEELCAKRRNIRRFYCEDRGYLGKKDQLTSDESWKRPLFVQFTKVLDGKKDCWDGSDECPSFMFENDPFSSHFYLIKNMALTIIIWLIALLAIAGNLVVIWLSFVKLTQSKSKFSPMMRANHILVLNLAIADLLMGVYLLALAVQNSITSGSYCHVDRIWRTGSSCASLGTLAMTSIQASVLMLLILTTCRVLSLLKPFSADSIHIKYTTLTIALAWMLSIALACIPRLSYLEDYFMSEIWLSSTFDIFPTSNLNKTTLHQFAQNLMSYKAIEDNATMEDLISFTNYNEYMSWSSIIQSIDQTYPEFWKQFEILGRFGFYSSNAVCLPKIFVTMNDKAWFYSVIIVMFDLISFIYILVSYIVIYNDARRVVGGNRNKENKVMQARITRLVLTDFLCWVPVGVLAFLSLFEVYQSNVAYAFAAIILLPINSALNPILYSNVLNVIYSNYLNSVLSSTRQRLHRASLRRIRKRSIYSRSSVATTMATSHDFLQSPDDGGISPNGELFPLDPPATEAATFASTKV